MPLPTYRQQCISAILALRLGTRTVQSFDDNWVVLSLEAAERIMDSIEGVGIPETTHYERATRYIAEHEPPYAAIQAVAIAQVHATLHLADALDGNVALLQERREGRPWMSAIDRTLCQRPGCGHGPEDHSPRDNDMCMRCRCDGYSPRIDRPESTPQPSELTSLDIANQIKALLNELIDKRGNTHLIPVLRVTQGFINKTIHADEI